MLLYALSQQSGKLTKTKSFKYSYPVMKILRNIIHNVCSLLLLFTLMFTRLDSIGSYKDIYTGIRWIDKINLKFRETHQMYFEDMEKKYFICWSFHSSKYHTPLIRWIVATHYWPHTTTWKKNVLFFLIHYVLSFRVIDHGSLGTNDRCYHMISFFFHIQ